MERYPCSIKDGLLKFFKFNAMEAINNGGEYTRNYEKTEKDIIKLKLIKEELNRRRLQRKNQFHHLIHSDL